MPWQLIYTSAPRGLLSGQSGFCTVARSADLREALVQRLEQISSYHYLRVSEAATANRNPTISAFRLLDLRGAKYYVLTRIQPCGLDFTARTNHLAHHLVFQPDELARLPSPAAILRHWPGWVASWQGEPRLLEQVGPDDFEAAAKTFLPAHTWARVTGDGGRAAGLLESDCVRGCYLVCPPGSEEQVLQMYAETLQLLNFNGQFPLRPWRHTFTAFLQAEDNPNDFQWRGCQENTPAYKQALTRSAPMIALRSVRVPANSLVKLAREEPKPPAAPAPASRPPKADLPPKPPLSLRHESASRMVSGPPPLIESLRAKRPVRAAKPAWLDLNFSIHSATLMRVGIFVAVLVVLLLIKHHSSHQPGEQPGPALTPASQPPPLVATPPKMTEIKDTPTMAPEPNARQLVTMVGNGPTFVLVVPNLADFSLPIDSISPLQRMLTSYDSLNNDALPKQIQLRLNTNRWDFPPGEAMEVDPLTTPHQFSATLNGLDVKFNYADWWAAKKGQPIAVHAILPGVSGSFSMYFSFSSSNLDPFRLLIVDENNPPAPLRIAKELVQHERHDLLVSDAVRLIPDFHLLAGRQWQLQPLQLFVRTASLRPHAQYLYKDWPDRFLPAPGQEMDFASLRRELLKDQHEWQKELQPRMEFLGLAVGQFLGCTNANMASFLAFSPEDLSRRKFAEYLKKLKESAPDGSWIKSNKWQHVEADQSEKEASGKFRKLYELWISNSPPDQPKLTVPIKIGTTDGETNYFMAAWHILKETQVEQGELAQVQERLSDLDHACIALCIVDQVDPKQPRPGLEMMRFDGP